MSSSGIVQPVSGFPNISYNYSTIVDMKRRYPYKTALLGWFLDYYKNIVTEDKKNPLFFRTKIYQAFPQNPFHKFKNIKKVGERWMVGQNNSWNVLQSVDMAERDRIQRMIRTKLNQITEINFNQIQNEFIQEIMQIEIFELYDIIVSEIYEKFLYEKKFQDGYIKLIKQINKLREISTKLVTISIDENNQFYWFTNTSDSQFNLNTNERLNGPFESEEKVMEDISKNIQLKYQLIEFLQKQFNKRGEHIKEIRRLSEQGENNDDIQETIYRIRRNIFGVIEMIGRLYQEKIISINVIHNILLSLFHLHEYEKKKRFSSNITTEEIEAIIVLWNYISNDLKTSSKQEDHKYYGEYMYMFEHIRRINKDSRISFLLMDVFENNPNNDEINEIDNHKEEIENDWESDLNNDESKLSKYMNEYLEHQQIERITGQLIKTFTCLNIYIEKIILFTLENMDQTQIIRSLWRILISEKIIKIDGFMKKYNEMMNNADDWEIDFPDFSDKLSTIRTWTL
jgi:hypothetical protein